MNGVILGKGTKTRFWLDPRTKFMMLLVVNIVLVTGGFSGLSAVLRPALALLPFFLLLVEGRHHPALLYGLLILGAFSAEIMLISRSQGMWNLMIVIFTGVITRYLPGLVMGYYVVTTTKIAELIGAMEGLGLPQKIIIPFAVMLRFIPTVVEENAAINDAMRMRGIRLGGQRPGAMLEYRLIPMMMCTVKIGEELSAAALTRGLGRPVKRTNICSIGFGLMDWLIMVITWGALAIWLVM